MKLTTTGQRIASLVRFHPGITRAGLAEYLGVSVSSVNPTVADLVDGGVIVETDIAKAANGRGRPTLGLKILGDYDNLAAVVWSHGFLDCALMRFDRTIVWRDRMRVDEDPNLARIAAAIRVLFDKAEEVESTRKPFAVVVGLPAPYEHGVGIPLDDQPTPRSESRNAFSTWFQGDPVAVLSEEFDVPVRVENDANLGALGEAMNGEAGDDECAVYVKLSGFGIGAGITARGRLFTGSRGLAGEIAHMRVDDASTTLCACGSRGCLEEKVGSAILDPLKPIHGDDLDWEGFLALIDRGDQGAIRIMKDAGRLIGRPLADIATILNPSSIVLDAGSARGSSVLIAGVAEQIEQSAPPFARSALELKASRTGNDAALLGALEVARVLSVGKVMSGKSSERRRRAQRLNTVWV